MTDMKMRGKFKEIQQALSQEDERKIIWASTRSFLEIDDYKHRRNGGKRKSYWTLFERLLHVFSFFLKAAGLYEKGRNNALNIVVNKIQIGFLNLPDSFNGYKILHLTDLHLDSTKGIEDTISKKIENLDYDLCVMTGDYRNRTHGNFKQILLPMKKLVKTINSKDGILAVLGNHDTYQMVNYMEEMGIRVLTNETVTIYRKGEYIAVTGIDDPSNYYTEQITEALEEKTRDFKIVLAHSPEIYDTAADNGYNLYLCGHTHGGQICLPGGIPIFTHLRTGKSYCKGAWSYAGMKGYTSSGCGTSGIPVRFNCHSEIPLIELSALRAGF
ncbi:MAG: metallophosphoesterase [Desulfobulbaceae bacterium]|nr:metallophosphoesterase [Desulfobulbaceae bacterium]